LLSGVDDHGWMGVEEFSFTRRRATAVIDEQTSDSRSDGAGVPVIATCSVCGASERGEVSRVTGHHRFADLAERVARTGVPR
jgi:hypothetical protein